MVMWVTMRVIVAMCAIATLMVGKNEKPKEVEESGELVRFMY